MANQVINKQTLNTIHTLWMSHLPQKVIAEVLNIKYATVSSYCRSFKAMHRKTNPTAIVASILDPEAYHLGHSTNEEIINNHLARGE